MANLLDLGLVAAYILTAITLPLIIITGITELILRIAESLRNYRERRSSMTPQTRYYM